MHLIASSCMFNGPIFDAVNSKRRDHKISNYEKQDDNKFLSQREQRKQ